MNKLILAACAGAAILSGWAVWQTVGLPTRPGFVETSVGDVRLRIASAYVRPGETASSSGVDRIDLAASAPDFRPVDFQKAQVDPNGIVFLRLQPQEGTLDPGERVVKLYVRFLEQEQWSHPGGLIMRRFEQGSPYEREELYIAPPEGRLFAARCMRPAQPPDGLPNTCIAELRLRGLDVQLRFSPDLLPEWEQLMSGARGLVESMAR